MNIRQVNYFISVANHGSLSAASHAQNISIQAISKSMTELETHLGEELFVRTYRGMTLTPFGKEFYERAIKVSYDFHKLETFSARQQGTFDSCKIMLCAPAFLHSEEVLASISSYFNLHLPFKIEVVIGTGQTGVEALRERSVDALITIGFYAQDDIECIPIGTLPTGACMSEHHPLAGKDSVLIEDLAGYPLLSSKLFDHFNESIFTIYRKETEDFHIIEPSLDATSPDIPTAEKVFYEDDGFCFVVCLPSLGDMFPHSTTIPIDSSEAKSVPICLIVRPNETTAVYEQIRKLLKTWK